VNTFRLKVSVAILSLVCAASMAFAQQLEHRYRYKLHPGDQIAVHFPLTPEYDQQVTLEPDGFVVLNAGGESKLTGLTLEQATDLIKQHATVRLNAPEVHLTLIDFQHPYFVVAGEVNSPNRYDLREDITVLQAVMIAGGVKVSGKQNQVLLVHGAATSQPTVRSINLKHINAKTLGENPVVEPGDLVFVPRNHITNLQQWTSVISPLAAYMGPTATIAATH